MTIEVKIYYEDTDCGGVVYYANYLKYFERGRTEYLESRGFRLKDLMQKGIFFVVVEAHLRYHSPGRYGDVLLIDTELKDKGRVSLLFSHSVRRKGTEELLVTGEVKIASVNERMKPLRIPEDILSAV